MSEVRVSAMAAMSRMTVHVRVTGLRWFGIRQWIGLKLIAIGFAVCGPNTNMVIE